MATILIVEDIPANLALATKLLRGAGHVVFTGATGADGIALAREHHPDVVLLDLGLPDMSGWDALREMKGADGGTDVRVVAFTADAMVGDRERVLAGGFDGYLSKPLDFATFTRSVEEFLP